MSQKTIPANRQPEAGFFMPNATFEHISHPISIAIAELARKVVGGK